MHVGAASVIRINSRDVKSFGIFVACLALFSFDVACVALQDATVTLLRLHVRFDS